MFEGLVRQLLLGYLGRYIKDIQKDQLKITVWNEEVLLENVELILEAFEYLQLPFALKQGRVGKLSIKIPWKKLGREPIIIILEDVFVCASQRNDQEWSSDVVERRQFAGKKAKLAAAELAKLSRRVFDSPAGNPFMSYIAAKILDSIQVSIRNFHIVYSDKQPEPVQAVLGLRFSSLTVTKQNPVGPSIGRVRGGQVNKLVEIEALEIYCDMYEGNMDFLSVDEKGDFDNWCQSRLQSDKSGHLLKPVHFCVTLLVNRSEELYEDLPQYSISAELTDVVMMLNEFQLQQIVILLDYLQTCQLRERYGRYRPSFTSLSRKPPGWQKLWWHYAQESILSDVRKKLWKTSWRYLGQRMQTFVMGKKYRRMRRRYINFYKTKLDFLRREQPIDESVLLGLEEMEKESDIDDILSYRSAAEGEMQEARSELSVNMGTSDASASEKEQSDDRISNKSRGWLNWLSRGMLGAGGTEDSSQFSGVVSDEIVKDIHKATKFHPLSSSPRIISATGTICTCSIRLNVHKISATLQQINGSSQVLAESDILGVIVECKSWKKSTAMIVSVSSGRLVYPQNGREILTMKGACSQIDALKKKASYRAQLEVSQDHNVALSLKVTLQPLEATYDADFFLAVSKFFLGSRSFKLQHERVLSSLKGLDCKTRLMAKAEYILSSRNKLKWDLDIENITLSFPGRLVESESYNLVLVLESLSFTSCSTDSLSLSSREKLGIADGLQNSVASLDDLQVKDLYDHFEINICDLEMRLIKIHPSQTILLVEKSSLLIKLASCIIPEESVLKQLEADASLSMVNVHFSPTICEGVMSVIEYLDIQDHGAQSSSPYFHFTIKTNLALFRLHIDLENEGENSTVIIVSLQQLDLWYSLTKFEECSVHVKALEMIACSSNDVADCHILCSSGNLLRSSSAHGQGMDAQCSNQSSIIGNGTTPEAVISLNYKVSQSEDFVSHKHTIYWKSAELHCYPYIFGLLTSFFDKISSYKISSADKSLYSHTADISTRTELPWFGLERFGFSNFIESGSCGCISLDKYPFVTIYNSGSLGSLESSLCYSTSDWRKLFMLKNKDDRAEMSLNRECKSCSLQPKCDCPLNELASSRGLGQTNLHTVDLHLFNTNVHLHDSSSVFGAITLPVSRYLLTISDDHADLVASVEDLTLKSSLCSNYSGGYLWRHSLQDVSPVLNLRVRKRNLESSGPKIEVSIGIQHSCCILVPEYVAIIIGYFSHPDWTSKSGLQSFSQANESTKAHPEFAVTYKFEIVDSTLILPVECHDRQHLKTDIKHLCISFIPECASSNVVQDIPQECMIPLNQVARRTDCLNIFVRDLSLSLLLSANGLLTFKQDAVCRSITLAAHANADAWIRVPCGHSSLLDSACVMSRVEDCEIIVDDSHALDGFKALLDVIDQLSAVDDESKLFVSDVPQFRHTKMQLKQEMAVAPHESFTSYTKIRIYVNHLRIKLHRSRKEPGTLLPEPVFQADMNFLCSAELKNNFPMSLDAEFFEIGLYSLLSSVMLARCTNVYGETSALKVRFAEQVESEYALCFALPSLDIWLHPFDWIEVIELLKSCAHKLEDSNQDNCDSTDRISNSLQSEVAENFTGFSVRSEIFGLKINVPLCISDTEFPGFVATDIHDRSEEEHLNNCKGKYCKYVSVTAYSRSGELSILGRDVKLSYKIEKLNGILAISGVDTVWSCSLFGASQVLLETSIQMDQKKIVNMSAEILSDNVEMHVSHQVLSFWHGVALDAPDTTSSQYTQVNTNIKFQIRDVSVLISDGRWGCSGLLLEVLMRNFLLQATLAEKIVESSVSCGIEVNYNNMHKVLWEPFIEPWNFNIKLSQNFEANALLNNVGLTEVIVASSAQLNVNLTESLFECIFRIIEMLKTWEMMESHDISDNKELSFCCTRSTNTEQYAPYVLQNLTSLPLGYDVFRGHSSDVLNMSAPVVQKFVQPGVSVPIYLDNSETLLIHDKRQSHFNSFSSESGTATHHYMRVQLDGTSFASPPHSMDRIGLSYFEADFSKTSNCDNNVEKASKSGSWGSFVVPVVFEVLLQRQSKLIRVYSTVIILNSTSMPLELRFDIPFGVSPKIMDPIFPGQEFPLPLHLAKSGRLRWRPLGDSYLWSEAHSISKVLSPDSKTGFRRSFACYPCHPSNEPFRCCISVQSTSLQESFYLNDFPDGNFGRQLHDFEQSRERLIHQVTLSTPLVVTNCLPESILLSIESGGITQAAFLSEGETPFHHIDPSHDLVLEFKLNGSRSSTLKFPRSETFSTVAKFSGGKFSQIETVSFDSYLGGGSLYVSCEKTMDVTCGAREVFIFVPFLLYNCTGTPLIVSDCNNEVKGIFSVIPSCYNLIEQHFIQSRKVGLSILTSEKNLLDKASHADSPSSPSSSECSNAASGSERFVEKPVIQSTHEVPSAVYPKDSTTVHKRNLSSKSLREVCFEGNEPSKVKACIYSPCLISRASDMMIKVRRDLPGSDSSNMPHSLWSAPFPLVPPSGSTNVVVPQSSPSESSLLSVTCSILGGALVGRTQAITFQPRYIICNSCSQNLCYKQKGTNIVSHLAFGQHAQLQWTDTSRELLVSIRLNEPGWQWSGSFLPDHLGDTQLKIWNSVSKALNMVRVEVQNAKTSSGDEKIVGSVHGSIGTNFILLSDDDMEYMPYRIDNFSNERLRVYQQRCETFDTIVYPYTSCPYAWDEPCYPHRLTVEVPGDRVIGSYALEITKQPIVVHLRSTSEKPERALLLSICAEGATKVLSVVDSGYHTMKDIKETFDSKFHEKGNKTHQNDNIIRYTEKFLFLLPSVGISLVNSHPQELVYACASNVVLELKQSVDQQNLSFQISSLQIDNPVHNSSYPVILSFNHEHKGTLDCGTKDDQAKSFNETVQQVWSNTRDAVLYIGLAKWRKKDVSLVSLERINLRINEFGLELELQTILSLLEFIRAVLLNSQTRLLPLSDPTLHPLIYDTGSAKDTSSDDAPPHARNIPVFNKNQRSIVSLPIVVPIGAPWQQIHLLARRHRKIYVETFDLAPVKFTLSFCSAPWMLRSGILSSGESLIHRGLMALADVDGARIHLKQLTITHHMASWESFQEILVGHYTRQILHEMYKVFGSAGVIGNPMGFARNVALGIKDFLSVPARSVSKSPAGIIQGMAHGTTSLLSSTVYALSDAATQFSKAAHKGIVAFTFNDHDVARMEKQQMDEGSRSKGVIGEVFEGLTGLLQSPIRGAEKHGLPGVISGVALGITGLVARPTASILEVTGKTAQSIRNRSRLHKIRSQRHRLRLPRPLSRELPLRPYSWEEAVGTAVLMEVGDTLNRKGEALVKCKALKQGGAFVVITGRLVLVFSSPSLVDFRKPGFLGVPVDLVWNIEREISLESVIHADASGGVVRIIGSNSDGVWSLRPNNQKKSSPTRKRWNNPSAQPLLQTNLELPSEEEAEDLLRVLLSTIETGKSQGSHSRHVVSRSNIS